MVTSSSSRRVQVFWSSSCEVIDDDTGEESNQGTLSGVRRVVAYPPVADGATRCYIWVNAKMPGTGRLAAAEFA